MSARRPTAIAASFALVIALLVALPTSAQANPLPGPSGVKASTVGGDLRLSWAPVAGASAYTAEVSADPSFGTTLDSAQTYGLSFVPRTTLAGGGSLYWRVAAHESKTSVASRGAWTTITSSRPAPKAPAPSAPANGATVNYPNPVSFAWDTVPGAVSYDLQYSSDADFPSSAATTTVAVNGTGFTPTASLPREADGLPITWHWRVRAQFFTGTSATVSGPFSATRTFQVRWTTAASQPTLVAPAHQAYVSDPLFEWSSVPGARYYTLKIGTSRTPDETEVDNVFVNKQVTGTRYVHDQPLTDTNYYWQVTAHDLNGSAGTTSQVRQVRKQWGTQTQPALVEPFATAFPTPLVGTNVYDAPDEIPFDEFELRWNPIPRATLYEVEVYRHEPTVTPVLTCRTASTTATIVARYSTGSTSPGELKGASSCLWHGTPANRIAEGDLISWRVRGVDYNGAATTSLTAATPTGTLTSQWSDPKSDDFPDRESYIRLVASQDAGGGTPPVPGATAWIAETNPPAKRGQPAPLMTWAPVAGAVGYEVVVYLDEGLTNEVARFLTPQSRLRVSGVFANNQTDQPYRWNVRALETTNWSNQLTYVGNASTSLPWIRSSVATDFTGVTSPVDTKFGATLIRWRPQFASAPGDGGSRGYQVTLRNSSGGLVGQPVKVEYPFWIAAHPQTGNPLPAGTGYRVTIAPLDANGDPGRVSPIQEFNVAAPTPSAPVVTQNSSGARLQWSSTGANEGYRITYQRTGGAAQTLPASQTFLQAGATLTDLAPGTYSARVASRDKGGNWSTPSAATSWVVPEKNVGLTTSDNAVLASSNRVLDWAPVAGASRYLLQIATSSGGLNTASPIETSATSYAVPDDVRFGTTYYWRVIAVGEKWTSSTTAAARTVLGTSAERRVSFRTTPAQVRLARPTSENRRVTVTWTPLTGADAGTNAGVQYVVRYRLKVTPERQWTTLSPTGAGAAGLVVTVPSSGGTYEFQVSARNSEGQGPWSATQSLLVTQSPTAPRSAKATAGNSRVTLKWSAPASDGGSPVTSYTIEGRSYDSKTKKWSSWRRVAAVKATIALKYTYKHLKLTPGTNHQYRIAAVSKFGTSSFTSVLKASPLGKPGAPKSVKVKATKGKSKVSWKAAPANGSKVTGYLVQYSTNGTKWKTAKTVKANKRSFTTKVGKKGRVLHFRVIAKNKVGKGTPSPGVAVTKK